LNLSQQQINQLNMTYHVPLTPYMGMTPIQSADLGHAQPITSKEPQDELQFLVVLKKQVEYLHGRVRQELT